MRVLVTGSSGHVGGAVALNLCQSGEEVIGLSRSRNADLPAAVVQHTFDVGEDAVVDDILASVERCDAVVHAAANMDLAPYAPEVVRTNCCGVQNMLRLAHEWGAKQFVFFSSAAVIGTPEEHPVTEEHPTLFTTTYAATKLFGERLVDAFAKEHGIGVSFRIPSPVGPGMRAKRIFSIFVEHALSGEDLVVHDSGRRGQDYVDVRDIAQAVACALRSSATGVFNVASGRPVSNLELAHEVVKTLRSTSQVRTEGESGQDDDVWWDLSIEKARLELGFAPTVGLSDSIHAVAEEVTNVR